MWSADTELPGFPFTVILPIYDIVDPYSYIALKPNVRWKTVLIEGPCKVAVVEAFFFFYFRIATTCASRCSRFLNLTCPNVDPTFAVAFKAKFRMADARDKGVFKYKGNNYYSMSQNFIVLRGLPVITTFPQSLIKK